MLVYWIWLAERQDMTAQEKRSVLQHFQNPEDVYHANAAGFAEIDGLTSQAVQELCDKRLDDAKRILAVCTRKNIQIVTFRDRCYPEKLRNIADPPLILYYKGTLPDFDTMPMIGVVGTRKSSAYGMTAARELSRQIAACGAVVISGMAEGIDAAATEGALSAQKTAVGVLGCGVDRIYPACNRQLYYKMERSGCLISEYPPGTPPHKWNFPRRNRIISGISCGVLVVEAPKKSGALITARQALEQGRDVYVVPGNIGVASCEGSNALLRDGAVPVFSGWDVVSEYTHLFPDEICPPQGPGTAEADKKDIDNGAQPPYIDLDDKAADLSQEEIAVLSHMKTGEQMIDTLIADAGLPAGQVLAVLTMLEIKGYVATLPGRRVMPCGSTAQI